MAERADALEVRFEGSESEKIAVKVAQSLVSPVCLLCFLL